MTYGPYTLESEIGDGYAHRLMPTSSFGRNAQAVMDELGLDQQAMMKRLNVKQGTLSDWLRDRRGALKVPTLLRFATALGVSVDRLLEGLDDDYDLILKGQPQSAAPVQKPVTIDEQTLASLADPALAGEVREYLQMPAAMREWLRNAPEFRRHEAEPARESSRARTQAASSSRGGKRRRR